MFGLSNDAIAQGGLIVIALIVFLESGVMVGFFLPGDTLLVTAGVLAAQGHLHIATTIMAVFAAAVVGDNIGYNIGKYSGKRLFRKKDGVLFKQAYIEKAEAFYERHGAKTMLVARFVPIVRSFAPVVAGIGKMSRPRFIFFQALGSLLWATSVILIGYYVGIKIPNIGHYLEYIVIGVMVIALAPALWHILKDKDSRAMVRRSVKRFFKRHSRATENEDED